MGRPSKAAEWLTEEGLLRVKGWARDGLTNDQIAKNIGVHISTFCEWQNKYPEFSNAIKDGKAPVDTEVENALLKSALGYYVTVRKPIKLKTKRQLAGKGTIEEERIEYADEQVYVQPQVVAQLFWLKNRKPAQWREKPVPDVVQVDSPVDEITRLIFARQQEQAAQTEAETEQDE
jgi:hypothetical protein